MANSEITQHILAVLDAQQKMPKQGVIKTSSQESQQRRNLLKSFANTLENSLKEISFSDRQLFCDYSQGIANDTYTPWLRIFSKRNPKPTLDWSTVIFFAEDGNSVVISASQGIYEAGLKLGKKISSEVFSDSKYPSQYKKPMNIGLSKKAIEYQAVTPLSFTLSREQLKNTSDQELLNLIMEFFEQTEQLAEDYPITNVKRIPNTSRSIGYWLFQYNEKFWDLKKFLSDGHTDIEFKIGNYKQRVKIGDKIVMWRSGSKAGLVAFGEVLLPPEDKKIDEITGKYFLAEVDKEAIDTRVTIRIDQFLDEPVAKESLEPGLNQNNIFKAPQSTSPFLLTKEEYDYLLKKAGNPIVDLIMNSELAKLSDVTFLPELWLHDAIQVLNKKRQVILQGPPGTGKTYLAREIAKYLAPKANTRLVQFHPSYAYEDFIQGYRPVSSDFGLKFEVSNGVLVDLAYEAQERPDEDFVLIIDEINRGNLAKVFGELYFLLEYRDEEVMLQYADSDKLFRLPKNLKIIGTMNTADRSIASLDAAIRRRFAFIDLKPDQYPVNEVLEKWLSKNSLPTYLNDIHVYVNERIVDSRFKLGSSYFMKLDIVETLDAVWNYEILPQLNEIFFEDQSQLEEFELKRVLRDLGIER